MGPMETWAYEQQRGAGAEARNHWRDAIDDALVHSGLDCIGPDDEPKEALARLIAWERQMALDPSISEEAQRLQDLARWPPCTFVQSDHHKDYCATCGIAGRADHG